MGDKMHSHDSNCIYSVAKSNGDSIKFSLSIAEQRAVGFIPAWSLASLHSVANQWVIINLTTKEIFQKVPKNLAGSLYQLDFPTMVSRSYRENLILTMGNCYYKRKRCGPTSNNSYNEGIKTLHLKEEYVFQPEAYVKHLISLCFFTPRVQLRFSEELY